MKRDAQPFIPATPGEVLAIGHAIEGKLVRLLIDGKLSHEQAQKILLEKGAQTTIEQVAQEVAKTYLGIEIYVHKKERKTLQKFFKEVLSATVDLSDVVFPETQNGFATFMAVPVEFRDKEDLVAERGTKNFSVGLYHYQNPIAKKIDRALEQKRPDGSYVFAHRGGDEPDAEHLGKSYDDAMVADMIFANPLEYLLMTLYHRWLYNKWMDEKGWTRTSSLWSDGNLVNGSWDPGNRGLKLVDGSRGDRNATSGPRQLIL